MSSEQFKRWSERWDTQYIFDKYYLETGEKPLRLCCDCDTVYHVEKDSKFPLRCTNLRCSWNYDENGKYRHWHEYDPPLSSRIRKHIIALGESIKCCDECRTRTTGTLEGKRIIRKDFAMLCAEARLQRFNGRMGEDFDRNVARSFPLKAKQNRVNDLRKTILFLVENCTAWLYLNMPNDWQHLKTMVSHLFHQLLAMEWKKSAERDDITPRVKDLNAATRNLISFFLQYAKNTDRTTDAF